MFLTGCIKNLRNAFKTHFNLSLFSEPTFHIVERPCSEQSEPILQRESLHGPVGAHHQPAWTMTSELQKKKKNKRLWMDI